MIEREFQLSENEFLRLECEQGESLVHTVRLMRGGSSVQEQSFTNQADLARSFFWHVMGKLCKDQEKKYAGLHMHFSETDGRIQRN